MNRKWGVGLSILAVVMVAGSSCKSKKVITPPIVQEKITTPSENALLIKKINNTANDFAYYSVRGKAEYSDPGMTQSLGLQIVMEKDKFIWISVTAILGIEAARIMINADSVIILDRLHSKCIVAGFDYIRKMANADLKLQQLQQIIIGNAPFQAHEEKSLTDTIVHHIVVGTAVGEQKQTAFYDTALRLLKTVLEDSKAGRQFIVSYSEPYQEGSSMYPAGININIRAEKSVECKITLNKFAFDKKKDVQFSIPKTYEVVNR